TVVLSPSANVGVAAFLGTGAGSVSTNNIGLGAAQTQEFTFNNDLKIDSWDFDVTQAFRVCHLDVNAGAGIRYFHMAQDTSATRTATGLARGFVGAAAEVDSTSYNSFGPTLLVEMRRHVGDRGIGVYANVRGGLLFGSRHDRVYALSQFGAAAAPAVFSGTIGSDQDATIGLSELEIGLEWKGHMGRVNPFARVGFEAREYFGIGNAENIFGGGNGNVGAYGLALTSGIGF